MPNLFENIYKLPYLKDSIGLSARTAAIVLGAATALTGAVSAQQGFVYDDVTEFYYYFGTIDGSQTINPGFGDFNVDLVEITITDADAFFAALIDAVVGPYANELVLLLATGPLLDLGSYADTVVFESEVNGAICACDGPFPEGEYTIIVVANYQGDTGDYLMLFDGVAPGFIWEDFKSTLASMMRLTTNKAAGNTRMGAGGSFAARNALSLLALGPSGQDGRQAVIATKDGKLVGNVYSWLQIAGFNASQGSTREYSGAGVQVGLDVAFSPNWIAGLSLGYDDLSGRTTVVSTKGEYRYVQPYLGYQRGDWSGELSLALGRADYTQTAGAAVGTAKSDVTSLAFAMRKRIDMNGVWAVSPTLAGNFGQEKITATGGALTSLNTDRMTFSDTSMGARFDRALSSGRGYLGAYADYVDSNAPASLAIRGFRPEGLSARFEAGAGFAVGSKGQLDIGLEAGGIGSDLINYSGRIRLSFAF